jgi:hypothetical protein
MNGKTDHWSIIIEDDLIDLVRFKLNLPIVRVASQQNCHLLPPRVVVAVVDGEIRKYLIVHRLYPHLRVAEDYVIVVVGHRPPVLLHGEEALPVSQRHYDSVPAGSLLWNEGAFGVGSQVHGVCGLEDEEETGDVVDVLVEVDLAERVVAVDQAGLLDARVHAILNCFGEILLVLRVLIQEFMLVEGIDPSHFVDVGLVYETGCFNLAL